MSNIPEPVEYIDGFRCYAPHFAKEGDGFDANAFGTLYKVEDNYFWFKERNKIIYWAISKYFKVAKTFLEVGCGTGYVSSFLSQKFPNLKIFGSEIFVQGLKQANLRMDKDYLFQMDARDIPFKNYFDVIGMFDVLEHIEEDSLVLSQLYKAIKANGGIIITVPQHPFLWSKSDDYACHKRRYTKNELLHKIREAGFNVLFSSSFITFLMPILFLSRWLERYKKDFDPTAAFNIPPFINYIFAKTIQFEQFLMKKNISLPLGGSLLVVACKNPNHT